MTKREDGRITKKKLLDAACRIFAEKGFQDAKVADICKKAGANVAAVNYYFGDKDTLYMEAWKSSLEAIEKILYPALAEGLPEEKFFRYIKAIVENCASNDKFGWFSRLYLMEMLSPTGLIQNSWKNIIEPRRKRFHTLLKDIIGDEIPELTLKMCELSILGQCRTLVSTKPDDLGYMLGRPLDKNLVELLAKHIAAFSLAGIRQAGSTTKNQDYE